MKTLLDCRKRPARRQMPNRDQRLTRGAMRRDGGRPIPHSGPVTQMVRRAHQKAPRTVATKREGTAKSGLQIEPCWGRTFDRHTMGNAKLAARETL